MGEETQTSDRGTNSLERSPALDLTVFRTLQRSEPASPDALKKAFNDDVKASIGGDGPVDQEMFETVDEYLEIVGEPYSAKYFMAEDILNDLTRDDFKVIDEHILSRIKEKKQKTSFDVYKKTLEGLESLLGLDKDNETMHRILKIVKFIKNGR